jgi:hypothetical protein
MAKKIGKVECKKIARMPRNKVLVHFSLHKFRKHNTASGHHTVQ